MSEKIGERANNEPQGANNNPWESLSGKKSPMTFQVAPGTTKEAEFKRLTGEDWPGEKYYAETSGVDDDGYDYEQPENEDKRLFEKENNHINE